MIKVSYKEARQRYAILPPRLQAAFNYSPENEKVLDGVYREANIPRESIPAAARLVGLTFLGFLRPEELEREFSETAGLNPILAGVAAKKFNERLFQPVRSDLDLIYAPPSGTSAPLAAPPPPAPAPAAFAPTPSILPRPAAPVTGPTPKPIFNVDATPFTKTTPPLGSPAAPAAAGPAPVFLHKEESVIRPVETKSAGPRFNFSGLKTSDIKASTPAPAAARLEIGQAPSAPRPSGPVRTEATPAKVVHYSEWSAAPKPVADVKSPEQKPVPLTNLGMTPAAAGAPAAKLPSEEERKAAFLSHVTGRPAEIVPPPASPGPNQPGSSLPAPSVPPPSAPIAEKVPAAPPAAPIPPAPPLRPASPPPPVPVAKQSAPPSAPTPPSSDVVDLGSF